MSPELEHCKTCGAVVATSAQHCPHCGAKDPTGAQEKNARYGCIGCLGLILVIALLGSLFKSSGSDVTKVDRLVDSLRSVAEADAAARTDSLVRHLTAKEIAKLPESDLRPIAERLAIGTDSVKVAAARRALRRIDRANEIEQRKLFVLKVETEYLKQGRDLHAYLEGKDSTTLRLKYVLFGRPDAFQIGADADLMGQLGRMGFRKVIVTDGFDETYTLKVPEPLVP